ncbi:MAG TPA: NADH-quinone oxidoreductase subunit M, partial [Actinomycetota bacterium]|nr:NADH-quinone oxidoreductase subunit M [Actinomycetota bacterium]
MEWLDDWGLTLATFLPVVGTIVLLFVPAANERLIRIVATAFAGLALVVGILVAFRFDYGRAGSFQLDVDAQWIPQIDARYHIGLDGISLPLFELSLLVSFLCVVYCWWHIPEPGKAKAFFGLILLLETGMTGSFIALDLLLFFIFWELVLVPMYFLIAVWGGPRREYSAIKFFLYTLFGSIFMLLGFIALYLRSDTQPGAGVVHTFDMVRLAELGQAGAWSPLFGHLVFAGLFLGFAIKVPMWPFHTWLPDAHTEAPTVGSVILAAILLKMGTYAFVRISLPILPETVRLWAPWIGVLAAIAIIYASLACLAQTDMKRLIAFSSVGHMGFVMLGIATLTDRGINGAIVAMIVHGLITGMLFFVAGSVHERFHTREISRLGGLAIMTPWLGGILAYSSIASLGLPGLAGFWGEFLSLLGAYNPARALADWTTLFRVLLTLGVIGTLLTAGYFLWLLQRVNLGRPKDEWEGHTFKDVLAEEWLSWAPLLVLILAVGVYPSLLLRITTPAVR